MLTFIHYLASHTATVAAVASAEDEAGDCLSLGLPGAREDARSLKERMDLFSLEMKEEITFNVTRDELAVSIQEKDTD